ncbi:MAG TPA: acyl-CoA desaturase [Burkholderiales bacterium]|nr:acyl-CoA desaturase [Burkholderiales bacterium]
MEVSLQTTNAAYRDLRDELKRQGLLDCKPGWYAGRVVANFTFLAASVSLLLSAEALATFCAAALLLAFAMVQIGFTGHDAQHGQVLRSHRVRQFLGLIHWNLLTGLSNSWWQDKHTRHHVHTNIQGHDPDMYPVLTFSHAEALRKHGYFRAIARYQVWFYLPLLGCVAAYFRALSVAFLLKQRLRGFGVELLLIALHHIGYFSLVLYVLPPISALIFVTLNYFATGLYMGAVFSPNHMAMPLADPAPPERRLHSQLNSTRNIATGPLGDFVFGGLNYQIEHHLFPSLPRPHLREASRYVRAFCEHQKLPYNSCDLLSAYCSIAHELHSVGAPLRVKAEKPC